MRQHHSSPWGSLVFPRPVGAHHASRDTDPDLGDSDELVFCHSGGKDGLAALIVGVGRAAAAGVLDRVVVQYNDLGNAAWPGTREADQELAAEGFDPWLVERFGVRPGCRELAEMHARHFGLRFEVRSHRRLVNERSEDRPGRVALLDEVVRRGKFPDAARRWCTSDFKRSPGQRLLTALTRELDLDRPARILYVFGYRAQESTGRANKAPCAINTSASNLTRRHVTDWYPVHHWTADQVWAEIRASGLPWAWPYDAGMSRLSCSLCVLGSKKDLLTAIRLRPRLARLYAAAEAFTGHSFQRARTMTALMAEAGIPPRPLKDLNGRMISAGDTVLEFSNGVTGTEPADLLLGTFTVVRVDETVGLLFTDRHAEHGQPETATFPADVMAVPGESR